ncbi:MAG: ABC transporter ATP-binding protein, partial [Anaerolineales bacterium]|nr:ABC transporter ATP-binding protein [Anaerolineales bacterium]
MKYISRSLVYLWHYWPTAVGGGLALLLVSGLNLLTPQLLRILIDQGISQLDMQRVWQVSIALVVVALTRGLFNFLQDYWSEVTSQGVAFDLRNAIFEKLQNLSFSYHDRAQTGKLMTRMTSDVELVKQFVGTGLLQLISALILLIGTLVIMFIMNWFLALAIVVLLPIIMAILVLFIRQIMPASKAVQQKLGALNAILQENLAGMRVVKAFAREDYERTRYLNQNDELLQENLGMVRIFSKFFPLIFFIANLAVVAVVWLGGLQVINDQLSLGELVAFTGYLWFLLMPMF